MTLKEKIQQHLKASLKERKELELSVLRMLLAAIGSKETEKRTKTWKSKPDLKTEELEEESVLTDEETLDVVFSELKKRKEAILEYEKGNRIDLADREKKEMEIIKNYLPEQLSEEEIKKIVIESINKTGAKDQKDTGRVMADLMPKIKGKADGGVAGNMVRELLIQ